MIAMKASQIAEIVGGELHGPDIEVTNRAYLSSRECQPGSIFLAIKGEKVDGHDFVGDAVAHGAVLSLTSHPVDERCVVVGDVTVAIGKTGEVSGDITAHRVMVAGKVEGNIYATERVEFHQTAQVRGDVTYGSIGIEHGAKVVGLVIQGIDKKTANQASDLIRAVQDRR